MHKGKVGEVCLHFPDSLFSLQFALGVPLRVPSSWGPEQLICLNEGTLNSPVERTRMGGLIPSTQFLRLLPPIVN